MKWFASESWNNGVYYYKFGIIFINLIFIRLARYTKAELWMSIAVAFCNLLSQDDTLRNTIISSYSATLEKLQSNIKK